MKEKNKTRKIIKTFIWVLVASALLAGIVYKIKNPTQYKHPLYQTK